MDFHNPIPQGFKKEMVNGLKRVDMKIPEVYQGPSM